jgi:hypothetical protein
MDILLNNRVWGWKHRVKGMGKGNPKVDAIEMSYGDLNGVRPTVMHSYACD